MKTWFSGKWRALLRALHKALEFRHFTRAKMVQDVLRDASEKITRKQ